MSEQEWILDTQFGKRHRGAGSFELHAYRQTHERIKFEASLRAVVETSQHVVVIEVSRSKPLKGNRRLPAFRLGAYIVAVAYQSMLRHICEGAVPLR